ncbi:MAG TPA: hypothetical protein VMD99_17345 [Terriglobales bacterium]|nr:hypothetical protein [Terriglobales bacterium]
MNCFAIDREAFTFTSYDLNLQIDPEQHRLGVRGKIVLRNDSSIPQKSAVLQISSSLDWRSIKVAGQAVQFLTQPYTSDIDHTGSLSEAIVQLPQAVEPHGTVELEIAYEGVIVLDATRLTRIGAPEDAAQRTDWDQISTAFTAVRGVGYVAWYPIATEVANLSEGNSLFEVLGRWKAREAGSRMEINISFPVFPSDASVPTSLCDGQEQWVVIRGGSPKWPTGKCSYPTLNLSVPTFLSSDFKLLQRPAIDVYYLPGHDESANDFADAAEKALPLITDWFGPQREKAKTADVPDPSDAPFESGAFLLTPLAGTDAKAGLAAAHQLTHAAFFSFRPWIEEGLAHFAQALYVEQQKTRQAALDYMGLHRAALGQVENPTSVPRSEEEVNRSLVNTNSEELYRSKAMCVWWMLRDMIGDGALKKAIAAYRPEKDKEPSYMPRLIEAQTQRDLEWFFDDWVYRDRGLPDFKVESAFPRKIMTDSFIVTVTVDNLGTAGAEVPVLVKFEGGEAVKRLEIRAKSKATIRIETPAAPEEIVVNDGSVPESNVTNNEFKVEAVEGVN